MKTTVRAREVLELSKIPETMVGLELDDDEESEFDSPWGALRESVADGIPPSQTVGAMGQKLLAHSSEWTGWIVVTDDEGRP